MGVRRNMKVYSYSYICFRILRLNVVLLFPTKEVNMPVPFPVTLVEMFFIRGVYSFHLDNGR
jgi:hypothetical protein